MGDLKLGKNIICYINIGTVYRSDYCTRTDISNLGPVSVEYEYSYVSLSSTQYSVLGTVLIYEYSNTGIYS